MQALWVVGGPVAIKDGTRFMVPGQVRLQQQSKFCISLKAMSVYMNILDV